MNICFISNYINHHQIPFCDAMSKKISGSFYFIQTQRMEAERISMGWQEADRPEYVHCYYEEPDWCKEKISQAEVVLFGGCLEEGYIIERLRQGKPVIRVDERMYKDGQWKAISIKGRIKKYLDHTQYRKKPVYFLCAGAYVACDLKIIRAYPGKKFCWGYFPPTRQYDLPELFKKKTGKEVKLLWAGRFIDWKHPQLPLLVAEYLKEKGYSFQLQMIGGGEQEEKIRSIITDRGLTPFVTLLGYQAPDRVREYMEAANIFLLTSDRKEGWGAVANEAMNSGCALVANHMTGAAPYLIQQGKNGFVYESGNQTMLLETVEKLVKDKKLCECLGKEAYRTITETWNAENAAEQLLQLIDEVVLQNKCVFPQKQGLGDQLIPCQPAPVISESKMFNEMMKRK